MPLLSRRCALNILGWKLIPTMLLFPLPLMYSQSTNPASVPPPSVAPVWKSAHASHLLGLVDVPPNLKGSLTLSADGIVFSTAAGATAIERGHILAVTAGDVRVEKGGTVGKLGRMLIPFGGGAVLAAIAQGQVDLLTVEFRDIQNAYHGAVFLLPKSEAVLATNAFSSPVSKTPVNNNDSGCDGSTVPGSMTLDRIAVDGPPVPAEYRVLLYEQMIRKINGDKQLGAISRDGDRSPSSQCSEFRLTLTLTTFSKGNAAVRATSGPLGMFLGVTSLKVHAELVDRSGTSVFHRDFKESVRGDSDSLEVANKIAKSVAKRLRKTALHQASSRAKPSLLAS